MPLNYFCQNLSTMLLELCDTVTDCLENEYLPKLLPYLSPETTSKRPTNDHEALSKRIFFKFQESLFFI